MKKMNILQTIALSVAFFDKAGNAAAVDGLPKWGVSDESLASLEVAKDGLSAVLKPLGKAGSVKVLLSADADLGEGLKEIVGESEEIMITGLEASVITLSVGEPIDAPVNPPTEEPAPVEAPVDAPVEEPAKEAKPVAKKAKK